MNDPFAYSYHSIGIEVSAWILGDIYMKMVSVSNVWGIPLHKFKLAWQINNIVKDFVVWLNMIQD